MECWDNIFRKENIIFWALKRPENGQNSNLAHHLGGAFPCEVADPPTSAGDSLCWVADAVATHDYEARTVIGWRSMDLAAQSAAGITAPIEPVTPVHAAPWTEVASVMFDLGAGKWQIPPPPYTSGSLRRRAAETYLGSLPQEASWVWTDRSATWMVVQAPSLCGLSERSRRPAHQQKDSVRATGLNRTTARQPDLYLHHYQSAYAACSITCALTSRRLCARSEAGLPSSARS